MLWLPDASADVLNVAFPPLSAFVPKIVVPSLNVTVPVGVPESFGATTAVNVIGLPEGAGLSDDDTLVVVAEVILKFTVSSFSWFPATSSL
jgi:hypothetical protein